LAQSAAFLVRLGALAGSVPRHGDGDEGRVLVASSPSSDRRGDADDLTGSIHAALLLARPLADRAAATVVPAGIANLDEVAWYVTASTTIAETDAAGTTTTAAATERTGAEMGGHPVGGGIARAAAGPFAVWLKAGGDWSHGHADLCSTVIRFADDWVVGDPGTGTYNGPPEQRDYFRTSIAHSVVRLDGLDQLEPHRAFRWRHPAVGAVGDPITTADGSVVLWGWHGSYRRLEPARRVARAVVLHADGVAVTVADWIEGPPGIPFALSLPLAPGSSYEDGLLRLTARRSLALSLWSAGDVAITAHEGEADPFDGWWSERYGSTEPSVRLEAAGLVQGPLVWQVAAGEPVVPHLDGDTVQLRSLVLRLAFTPDGVALTADDGDGPEQRRQLATPPA
jgi:hypothetical protein